MRAVLGLGGNLGDREENLRQAVRAIDALPGTMVVQTSRLYETEPFDVLSEQGKYLNACAVIETDLPPEELLERCLAIEAGLGRVRKEYHGARTVDIDLLLYEGFALHTPHLTVPHPHILERAFVLVPLRELFPKGSALGLDFAPALGKVGAAGVVPFKQLKW